MFDLKSRVNAFEWRYAGRLLPRDAVETHSVPMKFRPAGLQRSRGGFSSAATGALETRN